MVENKFPLGARHRGTRVVTVGVARGFILCSVFQKVTAFSYVLR